MNGFFKMWYVCVCACVHIYNGILFSLKKEGNLIICDNMDEAEGHAKWPGYRKTNTA